jgi:hypothetical protein
MQNIIQGIVGVIVEPFRVWWKLFSKIGWPHALTGINGAKNFKERFYYIFITITIPFILVITFVYLFEFARFFWETILKLFH